MWLKLMQKLNRNVWGGEGSLFGTWRVMDFVKFIPRRYNSVQFKNLSLWKQWKSCRPWNLLILITPSNKDFSGYKSRISLRY